MYPPIYFRLGLHLSFVTIEVIVVALIVANRRAGARRLADQLSPACPVTVDTLMELIAGSTTRGSNAAVYAASGGSVTDT